MSCQAMEIMIKSRGLDRAGPDQDDSNQGDHGNVWGKCFIHKGTSADVTLMATTGTSILVVYLSLSEVIATHMKMGHP